MADYKRMVSYMYQYENGVKRKNVGFVKVEARGGQCKISLHMQLLGQSDSIFPTYLISRGGGSLDLIYLGDTLLKNQIMDSRLAADEGNVMGSGYSLSQMGGILLFLNDSIFFASEWDDIPIVSEEVLEALRPKNTRPETPVVSEAGSGSFRTTKQKTPSLWEKGPENRSGSEVESGSSRAEVQSELNDQIYYSENKYTENKYLENIASEITAPENIVPEKTLEEELKIPRYKLPGGWKMVERLRMPVNSGASDSVNQEKEIVDQPEANEEQGFNAAEYVQGMREALNQENGVKPWNDIAPKQSWEMGSVPYESFNPAAETMRREEEHTIRNVDGTEENRAEDGVFIPDCGEDNNPPDHASAKRFFDNYPRIYPFEDNEIISCVKIEPKDIGLLPKELWPISNNSFLLHGFYSYHHLIFAKMKNRFGCRYIIGIPGIYHGREQFMAKMFGFENFKSIRKRELKQGDFGYWYLPVYF